MKTKFDIKKKLNKKSKIDLYLIIIIILICGYTFLFYLISSMKYYSFQYGNELCVIERYISLMSKGRIFYGILEYEPEFAARHFFLIFFFFLPIYKLYPNSLTLLFLRALFMSIGAIPVYLLARKKLNSQFAGFIFAISYLLYPVLQNINMTDYYVIPTVIPFLLFSFYFIDANDFKKSILFITLSLLCKENVVFVVILLGFYTFIKKDRKLGLTIILLGSLWAFFSLFILFPHTYKISYFDAWAVRWNYLGDTGTEVFVNFVKNPIHPLTIDLPKKIRFVFNLFSHVGFMSFLDPATLLIVAHEFLLIFSSSVTLYDLSGHQIALIIPFIFISAINGVVFLSSKLKFKYTLYVILFFVILATLISNNKHSNLPMIHWRERLKETLNYKISDHDRLLFDIINQIPENSSLLVSQNKCPQTNHIDELYLFSSYLVDRKHAYKDVIVEYMLFDWNTDPFWTPVKSEVIDDFFREVSDEYKIVESVDGIVLYKHI